MSWGPVFSTKSDVYSFGVLLLEIVSGRKNNSFYNASRIGHVVGHVCQMDLFMITIFLLWSEIWDTLISFFQAWELWKGGAGLRLMDPKLGDSCIDDQSAMRGSKCSWSAQHVRSHIHVSKWKHVITYTNKAIIFWRNTRGWKWYKWEGIRNFINKWLVPLWYSRKIKLCLNRTFFSISVMILYYL